MVPPDEDGVVIVDEGIGDGRGEQGEDGEEHEQGREEGPKCRITAERVHGSSGSGMVPGMRE